MTSGIMRTTARVTLTVDIEIGENWGAETSTAQVFTQARECALDAIRRGLVIHSLKIGDERKTHATVIGEPVVRCVIAEERK